MSIENESRIRFTEGVYGREIYRAPAPESCPFCGADQPQVAQVQDADADYCAVYVAACSSCGVRGPCGASALEAAEAWNRRA